MEEAGLQRKLVYCVVVAGKNAGFAANVVEKLFPKVPQRGFECHEPFALIDYWHRYGILEAKLREAKTGNYSKLSKCLPELAKLRGRLHEVSVTELQQVHGVGPKTARFFIAWTRPGSRVAVLDVHVLRWLGENGFQGVPKSTPQSNKTYGKWEAVFFKCAESLGIACWELDQQIWGGRSRFAAAQRSLEDG